MTNMDNRLIIIEQMRKDRYTFREIGEKLGITKQRVYQLFRKNGGQLKNRKSEKPA